MNIFRRKMITSYPVERHETSAAFNLPSGAVLLHGVFEERSYLPDNWKNARKVSLQQIYENDALASFGLDSNDNGSISLRHRAALKGFLDQYKGRELFIDFTGLSHHVWMALVRAAIESRLLLRCIYSEPSAYQIKLNPLPSDFFDLSAKVRGISPLPTFTKLAAPRKKKPLFIPLLGFEGTRFKYVIETLQPEGNNIVPIVGVPGFKIDFPYHAFRGNADALSANRAWENVTTCDAACPFSLYDVLERIQMSRPDQFLQVSPIGTKPHALGAALFAIANQDVELVYDHPVRKKKRTVGAGKCHVYYITEFIQGRLGIH